MTSADNAKAITELQSYFGERLSTGVSVRELHASDEAHMPAVLPDAVVFPESTEEVARIVTICAQSHCPMIPFGVGTSLDCLLYTSPSPRDRTRSRMPSSA